MDEADRSYPSYNLFLAGPFINIDLPADHCHNNSSPSKVLRYSLYNHLTEKGHVVYLGEDAQMRINGEANFGSYGNAVILERHHIKHHNHAVIVIPDSPGSFCEIGDWVSDKKICEFLNIIIDSKYKDEINYINEGIVKLALSNHASIVYESYENIDAVKEICDDFIDDIDQRIRMEKLYERT